MTHPWKSTDEKRTIVFSYMPDNNIIKYLNDMRDLINRAIINASAMAKSNNNKLPSPIVIVYHIMCIYKGYLLLNISLISSLHL